MAKGFAEIETKYDLSMLITDLCNKEEYEKAKKVYEDRPIYRSTLIGYLHKHLLRSLSKSEFYIVTGVKAKDVKFVYEKKE